MSEVLFEEISSDDNSDTSCDESYKDEYYCLPLRQVIISKIFLVYLDLEILNLDNNTISLLASPLKKNLVFTQTENY